MNQGDANFQNNILFSKAECYKNLSEYQNALLTLDRVNIFVSGDSVRYKVFLNKSVNYFLSEDYNMSVSMLKQARMISGFKNDKSLLSMLVLSYNYMNNWHEGRKYLDEWADVNGVTQGSPLYSKLENIYSMYDSTPKLKSSKRAFLYSFIPGMGIMYAGNHTEGVMNFTLNLLPLIFGAYQVYHGFYFTGYFSAAILIEKFYFGGRERTKYLVRKYNFEKSEEFNNKLKEMFLEIM